MKAGTEFPLFLYGDVISRFSFPMNCAIIGPTTRRSLFVFIRRASLGGTLNVPVTMWRGLFLYVPDDCGY